MDNRCQAIWGLSNIVGGSILQRDAVLNGQILPLIVSNVTPTAPFSMLKSCSWCISNLCRGKPAPDFRLTLPALEPIVHLLVSQEDQRLLIDAAWALYFLTDGGGPKLNNIVATGVVPRVVSLIYSTNTKLSLPCVRIVGNITTGSDEETQAVVDAKGIDALKFAMQVPFTMLRKDACWTISNIAAGNPAQVAIVIEADIIPLVCKILREDELIVKSEAIWILTNLANVVETSLLKYVITAELMNLLPELLKIENESILSVALQFMLNLLKLAKIGYGDNNIVVKQMIELGCLNQLESLQLHKNQIVYRRVNELIENYFAQDCVDEIFDGEIVDPANLSIFNL